MNVQRAIYPGTFDVFTIGHLDIARRAIAIFGDLVIGIAASELKNPLFTVPERLEMIKEATATLEHIEVKAFDCLLVEFAKQINAKIIIRGLRAISDYEYELQLAMANRELYPEIETVFLVPSSRHSFLSSSLVKEVAQFGGDISSFVPPNIAQGVANAAGRKDS